MEGPYPEEEEEWEEPPEGDAIILCPVCGAAAVRLVEIREEGGFYECESCGATFEDEGEE